MQIFLRNWYDGFFEEIRRTSELKVISPFVKEQLVRNIGAEFDLRHLELITRFNLADFALGMSSLDALKFCVEKGASLYGIKNLHSKVYLFDNRSAIVTSANLTNGGLINNYECGLYIDEERTLAQLHSYFLDLKRLGNSQLSLERIEEWQTQIESVQLPNKVAVSLPDFGAREMKVHSTPRHFVKFFGTSKSRSSLRASTRDEVTRALCHYACTFSENKKPRQFKDGDIVYLSRMIEAPNDFAIFGKAEAIKYVETRDRASANEIEERDWKVDWPIYLRVQNPVFIDGNMGDCVLLYDLIRELDYLSFPTTKLKFEENKKQNQNIHINPYRSLSQQPYVELTDRASEWVEERFQLALERKGQISLEFLEKLPQAVPMDVE